MTGYLSPSLILSLFLAPPLSLFPSAFSHALVSLKQSIKALFPRIKSKKQTKKKRTRAIRSAASTCMQATRQGCAALQGVHNCSQLSWQLERECKTSRRVGNHVKASVAFVVNELRHGISKRNLCFYKERNMAKNRVTTSKCPVVYCTHCAVQLKLNLTSLMAAQLQLVYCRAT